MPGIIHILRQDDTASSSSSRLRGDSFFSSRPLYRPSRCQSFFLHALRSHERGKFIRQVFQEFRRRLSSGGIGVVVLAARENGVGEKRGEHAAAKLDARHGWPYRRPLSEFLICETHRFLNSRQLPRRWRNAPARTDATKSTRWKLELKSQDCSRQEPWERHRGPRHFVLEW